MREQLAACRYCGHDTINTHDHVCAVCATNLEIEQEDFKAVGAAYTVVQPEREQMQNRRSDASYSKET